MYAVIVRKDSDKVQMMEKTYKTKQPYMKQLKNGCQYLFESMDDATEFISFLMHIKFTSQSYYLLRRVQLYYHFSAR